MVTEADVLLGMVLLPLVVIVLLLLLRSGYRRLTRAALPVGAVPVAAGALSPQQLAAVAQERAAGLSVIAGGWCGMAGDDADVALQALQGGQVEPRLDSSVRDGEGLPVLLARHPSLDVSAVEAWLATQGAQSQDAASKARLLRCLALLERALPPVLTALLPLFPPESEVAESIPAGRERVLRIALPAPESFDVAAIELLQRFIGARITASGLGRLSLQSTVLVSDSSLPLLRWLDAAVVELHRRNLDDVLLLIAADSALDEYTLQEYALRDRFYSARCPQGQLPGEAAAVLALAHPAGLPAAFKAAPKVHRPASGVRDKPIDGRGKVSDAFLAALLVELLAAAEIDASRCVEVLSDAGRSVSRTEELALSMTRLLPDLDVIADRIDLAVALGELGAARGVSLLVMAAALAAAEQQPVVVTSLADARERFALLVTVEEAAPTSA